MAKDRWQAQGWQGRRRRSQRPLATRAKVGKTAAKAGVRGKGARLQRPGRLTAIRCPILPRCPMTSASESWRSRRKSGFVPNVFLKLARRPAEFRAFFAYYDALMLKEGTLSKAEREMIVVATSALNNCLYCVVAHGAILRIYQKDPLIADQLATNYRKAALPPRQRAMLDFACKVAVSLGHRRRRGPPPAAGPRLRCRGHLGHRRHRRLLRVVQPHRQLQRHDAERGVLLDGAAQACEAQGRSLTGPGVPS